MSLAVGSCGFKSRDVMRGSAQLHGRLCDLLTHSCYARFAAQVAAVCVLRFSDKERADQPVHSSHPTSTQQAIVAQPAQLARHCVCEPTAC